MPVGEVFDHEQENRTGAREALKGITSHDVMGRKRMLWWKRGSWVDRADGREGRRIQDKNKSSCITVGTKSQTI